MFEHVRRLARGTLIYGIGGAIARVMQLILLPFFTTRLDPAEFGVVALLGLVSLLLVPMLTLGLGGGAGAIYFGAPHPQRRPATIWTAFAMIFAASAIGGVAAWLLAPQISGMLFESALHTALVRATAVAAICTALGTPFLLRLQFEERAGPYVFANVTGALVTAGVSVWLVGVRDLGAAGLIYGTLAGQATTLFLAAALVVPSLPIHVSGSIYRELAKIGVPLIPSFAFLFVLHHGNKYLLQRLADLQQAGIYFIGFNLGLMMSLVVSGFSSAWFPFAMSFSQKQNEAAPVFARMATFYVIGCGALTLLFFIFARPVTMLLTQPEYQQAYMVVGFSATAQFLSGAAALLLPPIYFANEVQWVTVVQAAAAGFSIVLNFLLIPVAPILGAASGLVAGAALLVVLQFAWNRQRGYLHIPFEMRRLAAFGGFFAGVAGVFLLPRSLDFGYELVLAVIATIGVGVALFFFLSPAERAGALRRLRPAASMTASP